MIYYPDDSGKVSDLFRFVFFIAIDSDHFCE
jgi:hypothetical protein